MIKVLCWNNDDLEEYLTLGQQYEVERQGNYAILTSDNGVTRLQIFFDEYFETDY